MKKQNKKIYIALIIGLLLIGYYILQRVTSIEEEKLVSYELSDYCTMTIKDLFEIIQESDWTATDGKVSAYGGGIIIRYNGQELTKITLTDNSEWTLYGLKPGMSLTDALEKLEVFGITVERHNMQYYATGILLEKKGIKRLEWDPNETITYVSAIIDAGKASILADYEINIRDEIYSYVDESCNVDIQIIYPVIEIENHFETEKNINENILVALMRILQVKDVTCLENISIKAEYEVKNVECENFSIVWTGVYQDVLSENVVDVAITCNIINGGSMQKVTDIGLTEEQIASEIAWRLEIDKEEIEGQLQENYYNFYVTPLQLVVMHEMEEGRYVSISMLR